MAEKGCTRRLMADDLVTSAAFMAAFNEETDRLSVHLKRRTLSERLLRAPRVFLCHYQILRGAGVARTVALVVSVRLTLALTQSM